MASIYRGFTVRLDYDTSRGYLYRIAYGGVEVYASPVYYPSVPVAMIAAYSWLLEKEKLIIAAIQTVDMSDEDYMISDEYLRKSHFLSVVDKLCDALMCAVSPYMHDNAFARDVWLIADDIQCLVLLAASNRLQEECAAIKKALDNLDDEVTDKL